MNILLLMTICGGSSPNVLLYHDGHLKLYLCLLSLEGRVLRGARLLSKGPSFGLGLRCLSSLPRGLLNRVLSQFRGGSWVQARVQVWVWFNFLSPRSRSLWWPFLLSGLWWRFQILSFSALSSRRRCLRRFLLSDLQRQFQVLSSCCLIRFLFQRLLGGPLLPRRYLCSFPQCL